MIRACLICLVLSIVMYVHVFASSDNNNQHEDFSTVDFVFDHISDSHEWFFFSVGDKHISIPLPVIIISKHTGVSIFFSNKFHHPPNNFCFYIEKEGENKGKIFEILSDGTVFKPFDFSITKSIVGIILVSLLMLFLGLKSAKKSNLDPNTAPKGIQNAVELLVLFVRDQIAIPFMGGRHKPYLPFLITLFLFILLANLIGLVLPLGLNITSNIAVTLALAAITFIITVLSGNRHYWAHIFNPDSPWFMKTPIVPLMQIIEVMGVLIKPTILTIRLFANMLAGHMIITVLIALIFLMSAVVHPIAGATMSLISIIFSLFIVMLDILVSFIQAYIFTLLSAMYFANATGNGH
jgi:F-type H+-transporting ATPase subunit a